MREANLVHLEHGPRQERVDPIQFLPAPARELLEQLREEARESRATARSIMDRQFALSEKMRTIEATRRQNASRNTILPRYSQEDDPVDAALVRQLGDAEAESARLERRLAELVEAQRPLGALIARIEKYVAELAAPVVSIDPQPPKLAKGESVGQAIARIRGELARLREDRQATIDAPIPSSEAKEIARAHIQSLAERGRPDVLATLEGRVPPVFAMRERERIRLAGASVAAFTPTQFDSLATMAWLFEDVLTARLEEEIDRVANDSVALTDAQRAERVAKIDAARLKAERDEESFIRAGELEGIKIARRPDADLRAVLMLAPHAPAAA